MFTDLMNAVAFLTVLPVRWTTRDDSPGRIFAFFPLVGLLIGAITALAASIRFMPPDLTAFLALLGWVGLTGGLHLDGFADSCDGLLATVAPERRLEIMKDPRTGSWAVIGVVLLLLGKWIALRGVPPVALILPPVIGRWAMVLAAAGFPAVRSTGSAVHFRQGFGRGQRVAATLITLAIAMAVIALWVPAPSGSPSDWLVLHGTIAGRVLVCLLAAGVITAGIGRWASARLGGGLTGDVYGALCEVVELTCLILLNPA